RPCVRLEGPKIAIEASCLSGGQCSDPAILAAFLEIVFRSPEAEIVEVHQDRGCVEIELSEQSADRAAEICATIADGLSRAAADNASGGPLAFWGRAISRTGKSVRLTRRGGCVSSWEPAHASASRMRLRNELLRDDEGLSAAIRARLQ